MADWLRILSVGAMILALNVPQAVAQTSASSYKSALLASSPPMAEFASHLGGYSLIVLEGRDFRPEIVPAGLAPSPRQLQAVSDLEAAIRQAYEEALQRALASAEQPSSPSQPAPPAAIGELAEKAAGAGSNLVKLIADKSRDVKAEKAVDTSLLAKATTIDEWEKDLRRSYPDYFKGKWSGNYLSGSYEGAATAFMPDGATIPGQFDLNIFFDDNGRVAANVWFPYYLYYPEGANGRRDVGYHLTGKVQNNGKVRGTGVDLLAESTAFGGTLVNGQWNGAVYGPNAELFSGGFKTVVQGGSTPGIIIGKFGGLDTAGQP